jgi:hypothetical protein
LYPDSCPPAYYLIESGTRFFVQDERWRVFI